MVNRIQGLVDVKRVVAFVLLASTLGMVFFVFFFLISSTDEDVPDDVPGWRGNSYAGLVVDIDDGHLTVHTHNGDNVHFKLDANTRYVLRANTPVKPGIEVKVLFRSVRGADGAAFMQARRITVLKTEEGSPSPSSDSPSSSPRPSVSPEKASSPSPGAASPRGAASTAPSSPPSSSPAGHRSGPSVTG